MVSIITEWVIPLGTLVANSVLASGAVFAGWVAWRGWKREIRGQTEYKLAVDLLAGMYLFRDSVNSARHPVMPVEEMITEELNKIDPSDSSQMFKGKVSAYENRLRKVMSSQQKLYKNLQAAEAIWGKEIVDSFQKLFIHSTELHASIRHHLESINPSRSSIEQEKYGEIARESADILYKWGKDDPYSKEFQRLIEKIESFLKPKLKS